MNNNNGIERIDDDKLIILKNNCIILSISKLEIINDNILIILII